MTAKILLVDDDPDDQYLTKRALAATNLDIELSIVGNGRELIELIQDRSQHPENLPDLILLDLNMPEMDGITAMRELRKIPTVKRVVVVAFSTSNATHDINDSYDQGVDFFLTKPGSFEELTRSMHKLHDHWLNSAS